jgi:large subunit ribosomal protein L24
MLKVKKNDKVRVISGKDKGKTGKVLRIEPDKNKIYIERINIIKKHTRKKGQNQPGGIISKEGPIHLSNIRVICPNCGKLSRVGFEVKDSGEKVRICRKCGQQI